MRIFGFAGLDTYQQMVEHFEDYNDIVGDHPQNMLATSLAMNAYMLTGQARYKDWVLEYTSAWRQRMEDNGFIIPTNIGLDGTVGGETDGKWYGGVYGWGFSVYDPADKAIRHRPFMFNRVPYGFGNGLLLTGDQRYVDTWRGVIQAVNANAKTVDGRTIYPRMHGDEGWYDFRERPFDEGALAVYYWSMVATDRERVRDDEWVQYLEGENPGYATEALERDLEAVRWRMEQVRSDKASADTRMSDDMNHLVPAVTGSLTQLMLGGLPTGREGYPLHARVRYFDPEGRRAGVPEDVAALVTRMSATETDVTLVNISQVESRTVVVQGGGYGEHQIASAVANGRTLDVDASSYIIRLAPGSGVNLTLTMRRYANNPTLEFPWNR